MSIRHYIDPTAACDAIGGEWATPSRLRPLFYDDPALIWLEHHGAAHGFVPETPSYSLLNLLARKGHEFEAAWIKRNAPEAVVVCQHPGEVQQASRVHETLALMAQHTPVIAQPALWWPDEQIYGVPDLLVLVTWLRERFPQAAAGLDSDDSYVVLDLKFTSKLDSKAKRTDWNYYSAQVRLYSFMLGQIQGSMPSSAFLITRDRLLEPLAITIQSRCGESLDADLARYCAAYRAIVRDGGSALPWRDAQVACNHSHSDERWSAAKQAMLKRVPGGSVEQMWQIGPSAAQKLLQAGIASLQHLLDCDPQTLPSGVMRRPKQMQAIIQANRDGAPLRPVAGPRPSAPYEFFVDCEFFSSVNVDFDHEWPELGGVPMIFMLGIGWAADGAWHYRDFVAASETHAAENAILEDFVGFLLDQTHGDLAASALYHWSSAERTATGKAADRHGYPADHILRRLNWLDLEKYCAEHAYAIPGAWNYSLKPFARALAAYDSRYDPAWPDGLDSGVMAQVMGWQAYQSPQPHATAEMAVLRDYMAADCRGVYQILRWIREESAG